MIKSFLDLDVYKDSFQLSIEIEELVKSYPSLIAEGYARRESLKDFQRYLRECVGEANEMMNHLLLAKHKNYIKKPGYAQELIEKYDLPGKKLTSLKNKWQNFK